MLNWVEIDASALRNNVREFKRRLGEGPRLGPDDEALEHLFSPMFSRRSGGHGLGLAIAKEIVELYGGKIWVESRLNEGSTFTFRLPAVQAEHA